MGVLKRERLPTQAGALIAFVQRHGRQPAAVGLETGPLSVWLCHELLAAGMPVVCIDAFHAHRALSSKLNKTDARDAEGLADLLRVNYYRSVHVKSLASHRHRALLKARQLLVGQRVALQNQIRGLFENFGIVLRSGNGGTFQSLVEEALQREPALADVIGPLLGVWRVCRAETVAMFKTIRSQARADADCRRLMTLPGVGAITALSYVAMVDEVGRFSDSRSVGACVGLTPRRHQSGQQDRQGSISRAGDRQMRGLLFEAAQALMFRSKGKATGLQNWARALAARIGRKKALVALARKLAVIMHVMLVKKTDFKDFAAC